MMKLLSKVYLFAMLFSLASLASAAQDVVHAVSGTVISIHPKIRMIEINTDDGSSGHSNWVKASGVSLLFDKGVRADTTDVDKFTAKGAHVIVYYIGQGTIRTAVAVRDLGSAPLSEISGTVVKLNRHERLLTIKDSAGAEKTFHLDPNTVGDTTMGVAKDFHYDFSKGDSVHVTVEQADGGETALLIGPVM